MKVIPSKQILVGL